MRMECKMVEVKRASRALAVAAVAALSLALATQAFPDPGRADDAADDADACAAAAQWILPARGTAVAADAVMAANSRRAIVLLGEIHGSADHHRWQLHTMAALHGYRPNMVVGVEMLPRRAQPILDRWVAGELTAEAFLEAVDWDTVWGYDPTLYLPLFHFARLHRVPIVALNVERALIAEIARKGWNAIPEENREGVSTPAPASEPYRRSLAEIHLLKQQVREEGKWPEQMPAVSKEELKEVMGAPEFRRFVEAQLTWDRAMAEMLAREATRSDRPLVIGIIGRGHLENRWGVPHQLESLALDDAAVLLPWRREHCGAITPDVADAVFLLDEENPQSAPQGPRLGIMVTPHRDGLQIVMVGAGGVADAAGLTANDIIVSVGGANVRRPEDLTALVRKQTPGAPLPMTVRRGDETLQVVARFPDTPAQ
jgi:uncharacterized iron-regulated protein